MKGIVIPVKRLDRAKRRLSPLFDENERSRIARLMLERVLGEVSRARGEARVFVVTSEVAAARLAEQFGLRILPETEQVSESRSVDFAAQLFAKWGFHSLLRLPADVPLLKAEDVETLLGCTASVALVPSRDRDGTNALLRRPPDLFPSHFGPGSLAKHIEEARRAGVEPEVIEMPSLALDMDEPADVAEFLARGSRVEETPLFSLLESLGARERLKALAASAEPLRS